MRKSKWRKTIERTVKLTLIEFLELTVSFMAIGSIITLLKPEVASVIIAIFILIVIFRIVELFQEEKEK